MLFKEFIASEEVIKQCKKHNEHQVKTEHQIQQVILKFIIHGTTVKDICIIIRGINIFYM